MISLVAGTVLTMTSVLLFGYGLNLLYLTLRALRLPRPAATEHHRGPLPLVCVQVPIYNERYVALRVLDAVCAMDWPARRLEVQVLDDSDDDTTSIVAAAVAAWRRRGVRARHVRRGSREGFKAGALAHGLSLTRAPLIAIFDADFVPPRDFLRRTVPALAAPDVGFVQARWAHLNRTYSWLTRLQALAIDFHFLVEQPVRASRGYFTNFTGTAGVWRRAAIDDAGGWSADTLTEDLDLSYRAQLRGWRGAYVEDLEVPEELPASIDAYRRQQYRWATGSFQSAIKLLWPVLRSPHRPALKLQAAIHLLSYAVGPLMLVQLGTYPALLLARPTGALPSPFAEATVLLVPVTLAPTFGFIAAQWRAGRRSWSGAHALGFQVLGAGLSLTALLAFFNALRHGGEFVRTPKHALERRGQEWRHQRYVQAGGKRVLAEAAAGLAATTIMAGSVVERRWLLAVYSSIFALGFLALAAAAGVEAARVTAARGRRLPGGRRWSRLAPLPLLGLCGALLLASAQLPEPFEDGYAHWLMAANLVLTGHLHDPLFGMEDSWLPGYHLLAAAVLRTFGVWQLGALKAASALLGLATLGAVYALAPTRREAILAVSLLALNPIFLFTSGAAVAEPLLTALLLGSALAAVRGRPRLAALLAALACATSTKAWIWIAAAIGVAMLPALGGRWPLAGTRRAAWMVPAVAVLLLFQLGFAPASHSLARGSTEVISATARGSLPPLALGRLSELAQTFTLAALPMLVFSGLGLWSVARRYRDAAGRRRVTYLYAPSLAYLAVVFGLVAVGAYSGSHRYFYPALPGFALLAANGLAAAPAFARTALVAASAFSAIAFLPVFGGFATLDAGLAAAGRAAGPGPGILVTDSPVAAFYSGRRPDRVVGSQALPADRGDAVAWLRRRGVTDLVLENISYYRATTVFPDLAQGRAEPPFRAVGEPGAYLVPAGKPVYVYALEPVPTHSISPGLDLRLGDGGGSGKTAALARGVTLSLGGTDAGGEGMGFGVPIVHYGDGWVYSRTATTEVAAAPTGDVWRRTFALDEMGGDAAHAYSFRPVASRGSIQVTYTPDAGGTAIEVRVLRLDPGYDQVTILNEESAAFDEFTSPGQAQTGLPRWVPVEGAWGRLGSSALAAEFSVPALAGAELDAGRELRPPELDWAGLDYTFAGSFTQAGYHLSVEEAR